MTKTFKILAASLVLIGGVATSNAIQILSITDDEAGYFYVGSIDDGIPSSSANELSWVNELLDLVLNDSTTSTAPATETLTRSGFGFTPLPDATGGTKVESADNRTVGSSMYALGKYGGGGDVQMTHVWYIGGLDATETVNLSGARNGLSHTTLFGGERSVPDTGSTLVLLGLGLGVLGFLKRRK